MKKVLVDREIYIKTIAANYQDFQNSGSPTVKIETTAGDFNLDYVTAEEINVLFSSMDPERPTRLVLTLVAKE